MNERTLTPQKALGHYLRTHRLDQGLTQMELSHRSGIGQETISRIEMGKAPYPRPTTLAALARGLGMPLTNLLEVLELQRTAQPTTVTEAAAAYRGESRASEIEELLAKLSPTGRAAVMTMLRQWIAMVEQAGG